MRGDFSRVTFDRAKHFSRVLKQMGRVTLDADDNEQADIVLHLIRTITHDLMGPFAIPAGAGFELSAGTDLHISRGHCYVDGILVENDVDDWAYTKQQNYPLPKDDLVADRLRTRNGPAVYLYLDVWERYISALDDDEIREKALGGPDTCGRSQVVWQVKSLDADVLPTTDSYDACTDPLGGVSSIGTGRLAARLNPGVKTEDPCVLPPDSSYRGAEPGPPTFKWARNNGSEAAAWLNAQGQNLMVSTTRGFKAGSWVELTNEALELQGMPGPLVKVVKVESDSLSVDSATPGPDIAWSKTLVKPKVRRWDQVQTADIELDAGAVPVEETPAGATGDAVPWIDLEDGIQIRFEAGGEYHSGDYWLIPARVATKKIEWPSEADAAGEATPVLLPARGIEHHYAPLGFVRWDGDNVTLHACHCELQPVVLCKKLIKSETIAPTPPEATPRSPRAAVGRRAKRTKPGEK
jgi:hypothetical protein